MNDVIELESIPTKIEYKGIIWIPETKKKKRGSIKQNYFIKWLNNKTVGDVFTLDDFFKDHPKHRNDVKCRRRLDKEISDLIKEEKIRQGNGKDEFKVIKL